MDLQKWNINKKGWIMIEEVWKPIAEYEGLYEISNLGNCRRVGSDHNLSPHLNSAGYIRYSLSKNGKHKYKFAHRLEAEAFIPNTENKKQVNHIDGNKTNNLITNLEWCNQSENVKQQYKDGKISRKINGKIFCVEKNQIFDTVEEASKALGVHRRSIYNVLNGPIKKTNNYTLVYKKD